MFGAIIFEATVTSAVGAVHTRNSALALLACPFVGEVMELVHDQAEH